MDLKEVKIWNVKFNLLTVDEIVAIVNNWLEEGRRGIHLTGTTANTIVQAQDDELLREAILDSDIVNVDSFLPAFMLRRQGYDIKERVPCPDIMEGLFRCANEKHQKVFFFGAKQKTLELLEPIIKKEYPSLQIVGMRNGYYAPEEEEQIAKEISGKSPDYVFIALPTPLKEHFIMKYKRQINAGLFYVLSYYKQKIVLNTKGNKPKLFPK